MASMSSLVFVILLATLLVVESGAVSRRHRHHKLRAVSRTKLSAPKDGDACSVLGEGKLGDEEALICIEVGPSVNNALPPMLWKPKSSEPPNPLLRASRTLHATGCLTCEACWGLAIGEECEADGDDGGDDVTTCQVRPSGDEANQRISCEPVQAVVNLEDVAVVVPLVGEHGALGPADTVHVSVLTFNQENQINHGSFPALKASIENQGILSDVVVFCEQEAVSDGGSYLAAQIAPLLNGFTYAAASSDRMMGMTGGTANYQKVSVMHHGGTYTHISKGSLGVDVFEGKGGVYTEFEYTSPPARGGKTFHVSVICAHLNAKKPSVREENVHEVMYQFLKPSGLADQKCKKKDKDCYRKWLGTAKAQLAQEQDHVIIFAGDLNHRIRLWDHKSAAPAEQCDGVNLQSGNCVARVPDLVGVDPTRAQIADLLAVAATRQRLIGLDTIHDSELAHGAQWADDGKGINLGYEFTCNIPGQNRRAGHTVYPPTYKRDYKSGSPNCSNTAHVDAPRRDDLLECYYPSPDDGRCMVKSRGARAPVDMDCEDKKVSDEVCHYSFCGLRTVCENHDMKKGELQLGWLDRVCFKANQNALVTIKEDVGLPEVTTADHYPVLVQLELKHP